ncbi:uncharacterized protein LOC105208833 [Zeugodacus cucurbitae]|uniref:DUF4795 domain-containing protein n=1 Tax=Zeugodacus cucurbitae TaxID=28588 RepID=A0A0A1WL30_ZEUCU|nr:uncharacterized protein LOC105208833 [Zeugodacus cucurbitae]
MSTELNFRQLIDLAIGSPEPGHVNFYALHFLLFSFAEKLNLIDEPVDYTKYENVSIVMSSGKFGSDTTFAHVKGASPRHANELAKPLAAYSRKLMRRNRRRETGGADPEDTVTADETEIEEAEDGEAGEGGEGVEEVQVIQEETIQEAEEGAQLEPPPEPTVAAQPSPKRSLEKPVEPESVPTVIEQPLEVKTSAEELELAIQMDHQQLPSSIYRGLAIMKDQLELVMEMMRLVAAATVQKRATPMQVEQLQSLAKKMIAIQKENTYIENAYGFRLDDAYFDPELDRLEDGVEDEEAEEESMHSDPSYKSPLTSHITVQPVTRPQEEYDLDGHLCYSPDKLLDQLMDLKSEFCMLTNKVNEITATILEQDCQRTTRLISDLQEQLKDLKFYVSSLKEASDRMESKNINYSETIDELTKTIDEVMNDKIDKSEIEILLANKVDYNQLQRKVSNEQMQEFQCRLDKKFIEMQNQIKTNDKNMYQAMDNIRITLGLASVDDILNSFKEKIESQIHALQETLRKYMDATNDECAAAGARIKVLQDLACISCDTTCVMRTMEKSKVAKLPNAHASNLLSPLITYEIGSIRKSGIMGYYRKDDFPHAPNAWLNQQKVSMRMCVPRHAGGAHTTHTAKEHFEKVVISKK